MNKATSLKWRQRARQQAEARDKELRRQAEVREKERSRHRELIRTIGLALFLALLVGSIAILLQSTILEVRDSVVHAIQRTGSIPSPPAPPITPAGGAFPDFGISAYTAFVLFVTFAFLALMGFIAPRLLDPEKSKDKLEYWSKIASIVSVAIAIVFGMIATLQAWQQIARAGATSGGTGDVFVAVHPPRVLSAATFTEVARVGPFVPSEPSLTELSLTSPLVPTICDARKKIHQLRATSLFVVGRHDRQPYQRKTPPDSNAALGQRRAEVVARYLREGQCDSAALNLTVITLLGGPRVSGLPTGSDPDDREVVIYAASTDTPAIEAQR